MKPLKLKAIEKEKVWGGKHLLAFHKGDESRSVGEFWEFACHDKGASLISGSSESVCELLKDPRYFEGIESFPILMKWLDASDHLSVQVHPNDQLALENYRSKGKSEAWYILDAEPDAMIILGQDNIDPNVLVDEIAVGDFRHLHYFNVKAGEVYYVPAGTIHAILKGVRLIEIQESSDITFRLYDYGRGRALHLSEAKEAIEYHPEAGRVNGRKISVNGSVLYDFIHTKYFSMQRAIVQSEMILYPNDFQIITCIGGKGSIKHGRESISISTGETVLIPHHIESYEIVGQVDVILLSPGGELNETLH